ncbi:MAG TPA: hypothetical protein VFC19_00540 [Candidatus Limnocylindrales bacterium]|nr:hypothetical protein [Candidatus Limnocylindrales bacterium]
MLRKFLLVIVTIVAVLVAGSAAQAFAIDEEDCTRSAAPRPGAHSFLDHGSGICWS